MHMQSAWDCPCGSGAPRLHTALRAPERHSPEHRRPPDTKTRTARDFEERQGICGALHGSHSRRGIPQSRLKPVAPHRVRWRSRQRRQLRARSFQWCRLWSSYRCRREPDPSVHSVVQDQCGRAHICRTTARGTTAKRSATYRWDTVPEDWTRFCAPYPCTAGQRQSAPCSRF